MRSAPTNTLSKPPPSSQHQPGPPTPPLTTSSLQMDSMNRYCQVPWKRHFSSSRRSSVVLVASMTATCALSAWSHGARAGVESSEGE